MLVRKSQRVKEGERPLFWVQGSNFSRDHYRYPRYILFFEWRRAFQVVEMWHKENNSGTTGLRVKKDCVWIRNLPFSRSVISPCNILYFQRGDSLMGSKKNQRSYQLHAPFPSQRRKLRPIIVTTCPPNSNHSVPKPSSTNLIACFSVSVRPWTGKASFCTQFLIQPTHIT